MIISTYTKERFFCQFCGLVKPARASTPSPLDETKLNQKTCLLSQAMQVDQNKRQRTANKNAAGIRRICERSNQQKKKKKKTYK